VAFNLEKLKPGVSIQTHRVVAASLWSTIGLILMLRGGIYLNSAGKFWLLIVAIIIGTLKSLFLLDKSARKNRARLAGLREGACLGGVYSLKMWGLIACMIVIGKLLRASDLPLEYVGLLFAAIGWALFFSSRLLWKNVHNARS
jgi:hypothetical protein